MRKAVIYIHGKGGSVSETEHYKPLFLDSDVIGFDYKSETPQDARKEFTEFFEEKCRRYETVYIVANSIGAFFTMNASVNEKIKKAFFISPVVDMEKLIENMMQWAGISENELRSKKEIVTSFGENLSWDYLCYVRNNPVKWNIPTYILFGENDNLTSYDTILFFAKKIGATLDVMPRGEHWFHTDEQMKYLDKFIMNNK